MEGYVSRVMLLNFLVDILLLLSANRLTGHPPRLGRCALGAALGGIYAAACLLPGFRFLGNTLWRLVSLGLMAAVAFGMSVSGARRGLVFCLLSFALEGAALITGRGRTGGVLGGLLIVGLLSMAGFRGRVIEGGYVPVELSYGDKKLHLTALRDTGNTLRDPVTGQSVLVVDARTAQTLTGLTPQQLRDPVQTVGTIPGLRLVPYRSVGQPAGLLLAMKFQEVKIGSQRRSTLVAFAPDLLGTEGAYQALTGGAA